MVATSTIKDEISAHLHLFETWKSALACSVTMGSFLVLLTTAAFMESRHAGEWIAALLFHVALWMLPLRIVHRPRTLLTDCMFAICIGIMILQPHMDICKRLAYMGAAHGAASVMIITRSFEFYFAHSDAFKGWKQKWRVTACVSAWGWHEVRQARYVGPNKWQKEFLRMVVWVIPMFLLVGMLFMWGKPPPSLHIGSLRDTLVYYLVRWKLGLGLIVSWFNSMNSFARVLHLWANGHELPNISQDPWGARTLKDFWGNRWNQPVQSLLMRGVFIPIKNLKWLPRPIRRHVAKIAVFVVSAVAHTYAISCGGLPSTHMLSMFCFFMVQIPLLYLEDYFKLHGVGWLLVTNIPLLPLAVEPVVTFLHL